MAELSRDAVLARKWSDVYLQDTLEDCLRRINESPESHRWWAHDLLDVCTSERAHRELLASTISTTISTETSPLAQVLYLLRQIRDEAREDRRD